MANTGSFNTGYYNTGSHNTGDYNTGHGNTGNRNTSYCNTGSLNTGCNNTTNYNTGSFNTGYYNTGSYNTGNFNNGNFNTGDCNTGNFNTGHCNTGNRNTGIFCTKEPTQTLFNKPTNLMYDSPEIQKIVEVIAKVEPITRWIDSTNMTKEEKEANPSHETTGGFLKKQSFKDSWKNSWKKFTQEQKDIILNAPNFDPVIFEEITGINLEAKKSVTLELTDKQLEQSNLFENSWAKSKLF